jgi:UDP-N-acetylmuramate-alanine ligase
MKETNLKSARPPTQTKRLTVALKPDVNSMLESLAESSAITLNEAIHKAIATEFYIQQEIKQGGKILVQKPNDEIREVVFR